MLKSICCGKPPVTETITEDEHGIYGYCSFCRDFSEFKEEEIPEEEKMDKKPKTSAYGFYCADCGKFVYQGYDRNDKKDLPDGNAVCVECGEKYEDKE